MKPSRITALLAATALLLAACKGKEETPSQAAPQNPLLTFVPDDAPYLFANLEATPAAVVDAYLARFQPTLDMAQAMLDDISIEIRSDGSSSATQAAVIAAVLDEMDGKLSREGLESLGLSLESHKAFYGMGMFPVMRIALKDAEALRAAIGRIEARAGMSFPVMESAGQAYWRITGDSGQMGVYIAILNDHLAVSAFPPAAESRFLAEFLGQAKPSRPLGANAALAELNRSKGFQPYGSGFIDFRRLVDEFLNTDSRTQASLQATGHVQMPSFDPLCREEIEALVARAPRLVAGTTELTAAAIGIRYQLEMEAGLAGRLMHLVSDVPPAEDDTADLVSMAVALQLGRLREFLLEQASELVNQPFQCPQLADLNESAQQLFTQLSQPMPPFIGNINGFRLKLVSLDFADPGPQNAEGMLVLEVEKPQMLTGLAQSFIPGLEDLQLEPGDEPVQLPEELLSVAVDGMHISAAMSSDALGIAMGKDQQAGLLDFLKAGDGNEGTFLSVSYDMAAQLALQERVREHMPDSAEAEDPQAARAMEMMREVEESYRAMLGRAWLELRFTEEGFEVYNRMTFN
jgi:hypothetical protein